jgi:hypothetical protein
MANGYGLLGIDQYTIGYHSATATRNPYVYYIFTVDEQMN